MRKAVFLCVWLYATIVAMTTLPARAQVQEKSSGSIVCWKDKSGKTIGCGDKVPFEYQDNASRELNKRGMTVKQTDAALTPEQKQAQKNEAERKQLEDQKREEEKRRDRALLDSFTNEKEIDLKRARDIQQTNLKNITDRQAEVKTKIDNITRAQKPIPPQLQEDFERLAREKTKTQTQILDKRKEIVERNLEYETMRTRFIQLKGAGQAPPAGGPDSGGEALRK